MPPADPAGGHLLSNLVLFGRVLRGLGLSVHPGRLTDVVRALEHIDLARRVDVYHAMRSLLVHRREDLERFDAAFDLFWRKPEGVRIPFAPGGLAAPRRRRPAVVAPPLRPRRPPAAPDADAPPEDEPPLVEATRTYSSREILRHRDFADCDAEELAAIERLIAELAWRLGERRTRRFRPGEGERLDLRRSLRKSLRHGGEMLRLARRERRTRPRPLVILADISGSMERYTRLLLHFVYGVTRGLDQPVEAFVFGTRLTRVSRQMRERDVARALAEVGRAVPDWTGGTRIGDCLKAFNYGWARRVLGRGAVVLLISDGWDRGEPELVATEMARLQRSCYRLVWLNPLLGSPDYEPLTRGMQAALPYIDDFLPVHNLASLEELGRHLASLDHRRHARRAV